MLSTKGSMSTRASKFLGGRTADYTRCDTLTVRMIVREEAVLLRAASQPWPVSMSAADSVLSLISFKSSASSEAKSCYNLKQAHRRMK